MSRLSATNNNNDMPTEELVACKVCAVKTTGRKGPRTGLYRDIHHHRSVLVRFRVDFGVIWGWFRVVQVMSLAIFSDVLALKN